MHVVWGVGYLHIKIDLYFYPTNTVISASALIVSQSSALSPQINMAYPNANSRIPVQQVISYRTSLALYPEDVGMVVGRQGRTINGIKNDLGLIELRVMQPNQFSGNFPWVFIHGINVIHYIQCI